MTAAASSQAPPLGKLLASTEKKTRDKAIKNLSIFLSDESRDAIPGVEMAKLWKGIFYCFWMSDKPLVQQALAGELAELVLTITSTTASLAFLRGFWETTVREWNGIDRLRMDKYLMLVRRFVNASFRLLRRAEWDEAACDTYNDILTREGGPLCPTDIRVPTGLAFHLIDIYLEELNKVLSNTLTPTSSPPPAPLFTLLSPFFTLAAHTPNSSTYARIQSALFDPLFASLVPINIPADNEPPARKRARITKTDDESAQYAQLAANACLENPQKEGRVEKSSLRRGLMRRIFEIASREGTRDSNRRKMYKMWKQGAEDEDTVDEQ